MVNRLSSTGIIGAALALLLSTTGACSNVSTVRLQPDAVEAGPGLRPVAAIQANAISAYVLFIPVPGGVDLDRVVNQMLVATAKAMGADKIASLDFDVTPEGGIWTLRKLLGWRSARATGIAVQIAAPAADADADAGPEGPGSNPMASAPTRPTARTGDFRP